MLIKNKKNFLILLLIFTILQPLLNVLIHFYSDSVLSIFLITIRPLFIGYLWLEIMFNKQFDKKIKIISLILLVFFGLYSFIHLVNIKGYFYINSVGNLFDEIKQLFTYLYFILTSFVIYILYGVLSEKEKSIFFKVITVTVFIVCLLMIISIISGTSLRSYENNLYKLGWKGWSTSTHYVGNVVVLVFPIILHALFEKNIFKSKIIKYVLFTIILISPYFLLGTKTPTLLILAYMLFYSFLKVLSILRKKTKFKDAVGIFLITIILIISFPSTYAYRNMVNQIGNIGDKKVGNLGKVFDNIEKDPTIDDNNLLNKNKFQIRIEKTLFDVKNITFKTYDNRQVQIFINTNIYKNSSFMDHIFGYGWKTLPRVIWVEADIFFTFFCFGILSLFLIMIFPTILVIKTWKNYLKNLKKLNMTSWLFFAASVINLIIITFIGFTIIYAQTSFYYIILMVVAYYDSISYNKKIIDNKKRYLFMINDMTNGGAEVGLVDVVNELVKKDNIEVDLLLLRKRGELLNRIDPKVNIISIYRTNNNIFYKFINVFIKLLYFGNNITNKILYWMIIDKKYTAEIAYIEGYPAVFLSNSTNKNSIKIASIRVGLKQHKLQIEKIPNGLKRLEKAYQKMDIIHCVSKETASEFIEKFPNNEDKVQVYYTYFNVDDIKEKSILEYDNIFYKDKINLLAVGRFSEQKGYDRLVLTIKQLVKENSSVHLHFIGNDNTEYGEEIKSLIRKEKLNGFITIHGIKTNPYPYIKNCDLLISSSLYEGYPRVINEAISLGKICIGTKVTGTIEALDNDMGLLVEDNIKGLVDGIKKYLNNDPIFKKIENNIKNFDGNKKTFFEGLENMTDPFKNINCLFITDIYPFNGEGFVKNDMNHMSKKYKSIDIITTKPNAKEYSYDVPSNVKIHLLNKYDIRYIFSNLDFQIESFFNLFKYFFKKRGFLIWAKNYYYSCIIKAKIKQLMKKKKYQLMYSYWFHWSALAIARTNTNDSVIKISKSHNYDLYTATNPQIYKNYICKRFDGIYPINEIGCMEIKKQTKMGNIATYHLGSYNSNKINFNNMKNKDYINLISVSRYVPIKRITLIIDILSKLDLKIQWNHYGPGDITEYQQYADQKLKDKKNIIYKLNGFIKNDELLEYYNKSYLDIDFFLNTASIEGIPVTIMEAMSYGIIPIATDVGGTYELVEKFLIKDKIESEIINSFVKVIKKYSKLSLKEKIKLRNEIYNKWDRDFNAVKCNEKFYDIEVKSIIERKTIS